MTAREWLQRGISAVSPIDALADYWRAFNNLYAATRSNGAERTKIRSYLNQAVSDEIATEVLAVDDESLAVLLARPVTDMRGGGRDTNPAIEAFATTASNQKEKLIALFMIIYQVRCNLEHGDKSPTATRDLALCKASAVFVAAVVERCAQQNQPPATALV